VQLARDPNPLGRGGPYRRPQSANPPSFLPPYFRAHVNPFLPTFSSLIPSPASSSYPPHHIPSLNLTSLILFFSSPRLSTPVFVSYTYPPFFPRHCGRSPPVQAAAREAARRRRIRVPRPAPEDTCLKRSRSTGWCRPERRNRQRRRSSRPRSHRASRSRSGRRTVAGRDPRRERQRRVRESSRRRRCGVGRRLISTGTG